MQGVLAVRGALEQARGVGYAVDVRIRLGAHGASGCLWADVSEVDGGVADRGSGWAYAGRPELSSVTRGLEGC